MIDNVREKVRCHSAIYPSIHPFIHSRLLIKPIVIDREACNYSQYYLGVQGTMGAQREHLT